MMTLADMMTEVLNYGKNIQDFVYIYFLETLTRPGVAPLLALGMIVVAIGIWARIHFYFIRPNFQKLEEAKSVLAHVDGQETFKDQFNEIDGKLTRIPLISRGWEEFKETIIIPDNDEQIQVIRNTIRPSFYLNIDELENSFRLRRLHQASSFMVGLGLLLTFIGLVAALAQASMALGAPSADFKEPIKNLLTVASVKFWTSVVGLMCSMALKRVYNSQHEKLRDALTHINDKIELGLQFVTPEYLAIQQFREAEEQTKALKNFSQSFAVSLANSLQPVFTNAVAPLGDALREIDRKFSGGIGEVVQGVAGEEIRQISNIMGGVVASLSNSKQEMDGIGTVIREAADTLREASAGVSENMIKQMNTALSNSRQEMDGIGAVIRDAANTLREASAGATESMMQQMNTVMSSMADKDKERVAQLEELMEKIRRGVEQSGQSAGEQYKLIATDIATGMNGVSEGVRMSAQTMAEQMERVSGELKRIEESMQHCVKDMGGLVGRVSETEKAMGATSRHLTEAAQPVVRATENIAAGTQRVQTAVEAAQKSITDSHAGIAALMEKMGQSQNVLQHVWENYYQRFNNVDESLGKVLEGIIERVSTISSSMQHFVQGLDSQLSSVVKSFGSNITELNETAESFASATQNLLVATNRVTEPA